MKLLAAAAEAAITFALHELVSLATSVAVDTLNAYPTSQRKP